MKFLFTEIMLILKCTERGQLTLPKKWRDKVKATHFIVEIHEDELRLKPVKEKTLAQEIEERWQDYLNGGKTYTQEEIEKKYGLRD